MSAALESLRQAKQVGELRARIVELEKALEVQTARAEERQALLATSQALLPAQVPHVPDPRSGAMFAPDQDKAAAELLRVLRPGGRLGMANWTPDGWVGAQLDVPGHHLPALRPGTAPTVAWGTRERLDDLLGGHVSDL